MPDVSNPSRLPAPVPLEEHPALLRLGAFRRYWIRAFERALSETGKFFGWNRQTLLVPTLFVVGLLLGFYLLRGEQVLDQIITSFVFGLAPVGGLTILVLLVNLVRAPYLLDAQTKLQAAQVKINQKENAQQQISDLQNRLDFFDLIFSMDRHEIERMVRTSKQEIYGYDIYSDTPSIEFWFFVFNGSIYPIVIDPDIRGFITLNGRKLIGDITTEKPWIGEIFRGGDAGVKFRLWLTPDEAEPLRQLDKKQRPRFNVRNLIVTVRGGRSHPEVDSRPLILNFSEIAVRRGDAIETAPSAEPQLAGKIICLNTDITINQEGSRDGVDCFFTMLANIWNDGATTTVTGFKFEVLWNGMDYPSVRKRGLEKFRVKYTLPHDRPWERKYDTEYETLQDFPVDTEISNKNNGRGWLRFFIRGLPLEVGTRDLDDALVMKLSALDRKGEPHLIYEGPPIPAMCGPIEERPTVTRFERGEGGRARIIVERQ
jgi:hypothetical protein